MLASMRRLLDPRLLISQVLLALAVGSGEILFWPKLAVTMGGAILLVAVAAVAVQYVVNTQIARVTIGRRMHAIDAFLDVARPAARPWLAGLMLLLFVGPWLVPGWALQGSQVLVEGLAGQGWLPADATPAATHGLTVLSILGCGLILFLPPRVFEQAVKPIQSVLMVLIVVFSLILAWVVFSVDGLRACAAGLAGGLPWAAIRADPPLLIAGFVFAGLGGSLNLGYSDYLREAGYARGNARVKFRTSCWEHLVLFALGNVATIILLALIAVMAFAAVPYVPGTDFLAAWTVRVREAGGAFGDPLALVFIVTVYLIFLTSELGIIDVVSRLASRLIAPLAGERFADRRRLVVALVAILLTTFHLWPRPPLLYLTATGWGNTAAMFLYSFLLLFQFRRLRPELRPGFLHASATALSAAVFLALFVALVVFKLLG